MLTTDGSQSFVTFLYADGEIRWASSSGEYAQVGINASDGVNSVEVLNSGTAAIVNIDTTSNVGAPGVWMYQVEGPTVILPSGKY